MPKDCFYLSYRNGDKDTSPYGDSFTMQVATMATMIKLMASKIQVGLSYGAITASYRMRGLKKLILKVALTCSAVRFAYSYSKMTVSYTLVNQLQMCSKIVLAQEKCL